MSESILFEKYVNSFFSIFFLPFHSLVPGPIPPSHPRFFVGPQCMEIKAVNVCPRSAVRARIAARKQDPRHGPRRCARRLEPFSPPLPVAHSFHRSLFLFNFSLYWEECHRFS